MSHIPGSIRPLARFTDNHRQLLHHAKLLSDISYGAAILYNLMLAEIQQSAGADR